MARSNEVFLFFRWGIWDIPPPLTMNRDLGVNIETLATSGGRVTGVETDRGLIESPAVVVATGPWCNRGWRLPWESRCP